jgi:adenine C2-methylase RlmN of 23S rRNA A2503 and tRNA A37
MGLSGNLTTGEILEQVVHANRILAKEWRERQDQNEPFQTNQLISSKNNNADQVRNIVFMGMGEPLDNYTQVMEACRALIDRRRWNMAHGKVTVSTVGLPRQMRQLTRDVPQVSLALSLHAPNQQTRSAIVPTAKHYSIQDLIDALDGHMMAYAATAAATAYARGGGAEQFSQEQRTRESSRRRAMIEYVMLEGESSSLECAHQLGKLCENRQLLVNLIPYNKTNVKDMLRCPSEAHVQQFRSIVASYGAFCTIRRTMGADIDSACGQLMTALKDDSKAKEKAAAMVLDIEDVAASKLVARPVSLARVTSVSLLKDALVKCVVEDDDDNLNMGRRHDLDHWVLPLSVATVVAGTCFAVSTIKFLFVDRRRRQ